MKDPLSSLVGYSLKRASMAQMGALKVRLAALDLRVAEATALLVISATPGISQSALGRILDIKRANMSPLIARMEDRGIVDRHAVDGRTAGLKITPAGMAMVNCVELAIADHEAALIKRIPSEHQDILPKLLRALWD